ncbi:MAG: RnfABCDGE type electron transport complex subunit D [Candidatus Margulisiibacteriota bacterium]
MEKENLSVSVSPHIYDRQTTKSLMRDVLIALIPAAIASFYFFGMRALLVILVSILGCVISEWIFQKIIKKPSSILDGSSVLTGVLLAFCLPSSIPLYMVFIGACVSITIGKMVFGGLGHNIFNPALVGRAVLLASWPQAMTTWPVANNIFLGIYDTVTGATPLAGMKLGQYTATYWDLFIGRSGGSLGETCAVALLIGGFYLIARKVISITIPLTYIGSVYLLSLFLGIDPLYAILGGGLFLGAFFMATDYVTSPMTFSGKIIFGLGCGLLTVMIRKFGGYPEGVCYAILFMNGLVPLIEKYTQPKAFGV